MKQQRSHTDKFLRHPPLTDAIVCARRPDGLYTNVPHTVTHHSPAGYEWAYQGSGPADLALNLCEAVLREMGLDGLRVACWQGDCFRAAWSMHQAAKHRFIASLPYEGGQIPYADVAQWVTEQLEQLAPCEVPAWM